MGLSPGMLGLEACERLSTRWKTKKKITEKHVGRHFLSIQQALGRGELGNMCWLPRLQNPAGGLTKVRSDTAPYPRLPESGRPSAGSLRPLGGIQSKETGGSRQTGILRPAFHVSCLSILSPFVVGAQWGFFPFLAIS